MNKKTILVVDDTADTLELIQRNLLAFGYKVFTASSVNDAILLLSKAEFNLVITDYKMPEISGLELIRHVNENFPTTAIIMITGYATIKNAIDAVKMGAEEYLAKPFTNEELFEVVERVLKKQKNRQSWESVETEQSKYGLIGNSLAMQKVYTLIQRASAANATALITGESGTGKELVARAIHYSGERSSAPFVPINCGAIPEALLESELFGYLKGAFTGANETRAGFFQTADKGTIFLDEISEASLAMQVKLLRVLQSKEFCMVGANRTQTVDARVIAASNKNLFELVKKGGFREDLFFRLNIITIDLPPLRERGGDIVILIRHFSEKFSKEMKTIAPIFTEKAVEALQGYSWPGNVRELENVIQRVVVMNDSQYVHVHDLPEYMRYSISHKQYLNKSLEVVELEHIKNVLSNVGGNKTKAAEILGIDRKTLREKLKKSES